MVEMIAKEVPELYSSLYFLGSSLSGIASTVPSTHFEFSQAHEPQVHIADWEEDAGGEVMPAFKPPQDPVAIQAFYNYSV
ncbi:hypothetical protein BS47DRAFT_1397236 [Hydnum rufescens UP504]|uniref:Uncharacterized protein n=1 Tax=Hydnum rufescens UP504 TaxID=1448309 RepID=A0A9P6AP60_9AGAM|nr:hypothetical protein BS47DRAFT_1397236 [Hydnum rufescens UP504]